MVKTNTKKLATALSKIQAKLGIKAKQNTNIKIHNYYNYGNSSTGYFAKMIPILLAFFVFFFVFLISGMALLKERMTGTLDRLLATPVRRSDIVWGYLLSYGFIAILQTLVIVFTTIWLLNVEVVGNIWLIVLVNLVVALVALTFGFLMSTFASSEFQMMQFIPLVVMPQIFFSGIIPLSSMASWVQVIGKFLPVTYAGNALTGIILKGADLSTIAGDLGMLMIFLVVFLILNILGLKRYRKV